VVAEISAKERFRSETWNERLNYAHPRETGHGDGRARAILIQACPERAERDDRVPGNCRSIGARRVPAAFPRRFRAGSPPPPPPAGLHHVRISYVGVYKIQQQGERRASPADDISRLRSSIDTSSNVKGIRHVRLSPHPPPHFRRLRVLCTRSAWIDHRRCPSNHRLFLFLLARYLHRAANSCDPVVRRSREDRNGSLRYKCGRMRYRCYIFVSPNYLAPYLRITQVGLLVP